MNLNELSIGTLDLADVGSWPLAARVLCFVLATAATLAAGYLLVIQGQRADLAVAERTEQGLHLERGAHQSLIDGAREIEEDGRRADFALAAALRKLPAAMHLPTLIEDVTSAAQASGLTLDRIELGADEHRDFYVEMPMTIAASGGYHQFGAFASAVGALPHAVVPGDFRIERNGEALTMVVVATSYRYTGDAPSLVADNGAGTTAALVEFEYAAAGGRSPFALLADAQGGAPPAKQRGTHSLAKYALARLQMVGTLAGRGAAYALLRAPSGIVHPVAAGDVVGTEAARVTGLGAAEVRFTILGAEGRPQQTALALREAQTVANEEEEE